MKEVKGWQSDDGSIHDNAIDAIRADAVEHLKKALMSNPLMCNLGEGVSLHDFRLWINHNFEEISEYVEAFKGVSNTVCYLCGKKVVGNDSIRDGCYVFCSEACMDEWNE